MTGEPGSRLERALSAFMRYCEQGGQREAFLATNADLRDLLEPMLADVPESDDVADTVLGGDFRLEGEIGRGGTGVVYAARQITLSSNSLTLPSANTSSHIISMMRSRPASSTARRMRRVKR